MRRYAVLLMLIISASAAFGCTSFIVGKQVLMVR